MASLHVATLEIPHGLRSSMPFEDWPFPRVIYPMGVRTDRAPFESCVLLFAPPTGPVCEVAVLILDVLSDELQMRLNEHWKEVARAEDVAYISTLAQDFELQAKEIGGSRLLDTLEDTLSNIVRITDRVRITAADLK